jgi:hypothetical protein
MTKTKKTKREIGTYCQMCGAVPGEPHQDKDYSTLIVALAEHQGRMLCQPCLQGTQEIELEKSGTPEGLLARAARLQTEFWDALGDLEAALDIEIESTRDLTGYTVEDLLESDDDDEDDEPGNDDKDEEEPA